MLCCLHTFVRKPMPSTNIPEMASGLLAKLPHSRVPDNLAPLARAVDGDGTSRRRAERRKLPNFPSSRRISPVSLARTRNERTLYAGADLDAWLGMNKTCAAEGAPQQIISA
jgi:hypothetical protein